MLDLAINWGLLDFLAAYALSLSSLTFAASASSSSSEAKRSTSSSSSPPAAGFVVGAAEINGLAPAANFLRSSAEKDLIWLYQRRACGQLDAGAFGSLANVSTSALLGWNL